MKPLVFSLLLCLAVGCGSGSNTPSTPKDPAAPSSPNAPPATPALSLQAIAINATRIDLTWTALPGATYEFCQASSSGGCNPFAVSWTATQTSKSVLGLNALTTYYFRARAVVNGLPGPIADVSATTPSSGTVSTPTFIPSAGGYTSAQSVTIASATPGALVCYGGISAQCNAAKTACAAGTAVTTSVAVTSATTLYAKACSPGMVDSSTNNAAYQITPVATQILPTDGGPDQPVTTVITLTFSTAVAANSLSVASNDTCTGNLQVSADGFNTCVPFLTPSVSGATVTLTPTTSLPILSMYRVRVLAGIVDPYGNGITPQTQTTGFRVMPTVTTFAGQATQGSLDGMGTAASFSLPSQLVSDSAGNLYIADTGNRKIRQVSPLGDVTTYAGTGALGNTDSTLLASTFNTPQGITIYNNTIYVADCGNNNIRRISSAGTAVITFAGSTAGISGTTDGIGTAARFNCPRSLAVSSSGTLFVVDSLNHRIRSAWEYNANFSTLGGSTSGDNTNQYNRPAGLSMKGSMLYISDYLNNKVKSIDTTTSNGGPWYSFLAGSGVFASTDGVGAAAAFAHPVNQTVDINGNLYVVDGSVIRRFTAGGAVTTLVGSGVSASVDGVGSASSFEAPQGIAFYGNALYVTEKSRLRKIAPILTPVF